MLNIRDVYVKYLGVFENHIQHTDNYTQYLRKYSTSTTYPFELWWCVSWRAPCRNLSPQQTSTSPSWNLWGSPEWTADNQLGCQSMKPSVLNPWLKCVTAGTENYNLFELYWNLWVSIVESLVYE